MLHVLAARDFASPMLWALIIGWILTVTLHELAHGIVGYLGGDYTIRERGGLSLNPLQYIDPIMSIVLPVIFLLMGGVPMPGGATYIRHDLLRSKYWDSAVSAAGPMMNLLLFGLLAIPLHPSMGWFPQGPVVPSQLSNTQLFVAALAFSQIFAVVLNLLPIPPLDGFGIIGPFLPEDFRIKVTTPPVSTLIFFGLFMLISTAPGFWRMLFSVSDPMIRLAGLDPRILLQCFDYVLFG